MDLANVARLPLCLLLVTLQFCLVSSWLNEFAEKFYDYWTSTFNNGFVIPEATIEVLSPKGFRASIPNGPHNIVLFVFQGNINRPIKVPEEGTLSGQIICPSPNNRWTFEDLGVELKEGDVINYYVAVLVTTNYNRILYYRDNLKVTVTILNKECLLTLTKVRIGKACAGQTIFEDNFDTLNEDVWQIEQYIPDNPEYPFVSYQRQSSPPTVSVNNGILRIAPQLLQNFPGYSADSIYSGILNFNGRCTGSTPSDCFVQASGSGILPPIVSGKLTSPSLAFTYGTVHIRAKFPQGDWIYPEILLEPFFKKYGTMNYASGIIKIATARGNRDLSQGKNLCGNQMLYGGPIMDYKCRKNLIKTYKHPEDKMWGDDFHVYSLKWTPDSITLLVDSKEWAKFEPGPTGVTEYLDPKACSEVPRDILATRSKMAPFDDHFYLTLGVAAGGISEFDDDLLNRGKAKPWHNQAVKARLNFWNDKNSWLDTWSDAELVVDYVKVVAL